MKVLRDPNLLKLVLISALSLGLIGAALLERRSEVAGEQAIEHAGQQADTALRVLSDLLRHEGGQSMTEPIEAAPGSVMVRTATMADIATGTLDRAAGVAAANISVYAFEAAEGDFRSVAQSSGSADVDLNRVEGASAALIAGRAFMADHMSFGRPHLFRYRPVMSAEGDIIGAIAASVPYKTRAEIRTETLDEFLPLFAAAGTGVLALTTLAFWFTLRPIASAARVAEAMARKDDNVVISHLRAHGDAGRLTRALATLQAEFAENARLAEEVRTREESRLRECDEHLRAVRELNDGLCRLVDGNLTDRIASPADNPFPERYEPLRQSYNAVIERIGGVIGRVTDIAERVREGSQAITQASRDLASRTESQAATLEQSAAALNELTVSVRSTAESAAGAESASKQNRAGAEEGAAVVGQAVEAMHGIERSSAQITRIVDVIDDIAFQTSLLSLNAGVEAARAGEAGRGFAVVASEVRLLAQRASNSAQEIRELIAESVRQVEKGSDLVDKAGASLEQILERANRASSLVGEIALAASEQANGLKEINTGINQLDNATQHNQAASEETTASAADLLSQSDALIAALADLRVTPCETRTPETSGHTDGDDEPVDVTPRVADWRAAADAAASAPRASLQTADVADAHRPGDDATGMRKGASSDRDASHVGSSVRHASGSWHEF